MKIKKSTMRIIILFNLIFLVLTFTAASQQSPAQQISSRIAQKMTDTLSLTSVQTDQIYNVNISISDNKEAIWNQYSNPDSIRARIQIIEATRDSLYRPILSDEKFQIYLQKKRQIININ